VLERIKGVLKMCNKVYCEDCNTELFGNTAFRQGMGTYKCALCHRLNTDMGGSKQ